MKNHLRSCWIFLFRCYTTVLLVLFLITGTILGILCACSTNSPMIPLMRGSAGSSVSIVRLSYALLLPFFAVVLSALYSHSFTLIPICFLKAITFSFALASLFRSFGTAGWLISGLLMASDAVSYLLLVRLSLRHIQGFRPSIGYDLLRYALVIIGTALLDCIYFAPFLVTIMND